MQNAELEGKQGDEAFQVGGTGGDSGLKVFKTIFEETEVVKKDKLKPQWLRDFQDSQRRRQSASP